MREMAVNLNVKSLKMCLGIIWHGTFMTGREEIHSKAEKTLLSNNNAAKSTHKLSTDLFLDFFNASFFKC